MTLLLILLDLLLIAWLCWRVSRAHLKAHYHAQLNSDLLRTVSEAMVYLPVDAHGARLVLARCEQMAKVAMAEMQAKGLWKS